LNTAATDLKRPLWVDLAHRHILLPHPDWFGDADP
jgi:hypothetical protein